MKSEKGITLIALVITIIVLLILAGVSISTLMGPNGIITNAKQAKIKNEDGEIIERLKLAYNAARIDGMGDVNYQTLNEEIKKVGYVGEDITKLPANILIKDKTYKMEKDGDIQIISQEELENQVPEELETYFFGEDRKGKKFVYENDEGLFDFKINQLKNIPENIGTLEFKLMDYSAMGENYIYIIYFKYENNIHRVYVSVQRDGEMKTLPQYGAKKQKIILGKYVKYDNKSWVIINDDEYVGIRMASENLLNYKDGKELDILNNPIVDWLEIGKTDYNLIDLAGDMTETEKLIYIYNNIENILNQACKDIVKKSKNIKDVNAEGYIDVLRNINKKEQTNCFGNDFLNLEYRNNKYYIKNSEKIIDIKEEFNKSLFMDEGKIATFFPKKFNEKYLFPQRSTIRSTQSALALIPIKSFDKDYSDPYEAESILGTINYQYQGGIYNRENFKTKIRPIITLSDEVRKNGFSTANGADGSPEHPFILE